MRPEHEGCDCAFTGRIVPALAVAVNAVPRSALVERNGATKYPANDIVAPEVAPPMVTVYVAPGVYDVTVTLFVSMSINTQGLDVPV